MSSSVRPLSAAPCVPASVSPNSIAPNPPTITSSSTCSSNDRNESSGFGASKFSVSICARTRSLRQSRPTPAPAEPESATSSHDAVLYYIDRPPSHRSLRKPPQIRRRSLRNNVVQAWTLPVRPLGSRHLNRLRKERGQVRPRSHRPPPITSGSRKQFRRHQLPQRHFSHTAHRAAHPLSNVHDLPVWRGHSCPRFTYVNQAFLPANGVLLSKFLPLRPLSNPVILSEDCRSRSERQPQSKDPYFTTPVRISRSLSSPTKTAQLFAVPAPCQQ